MYIYIYIYIVTDGLCCRRYIFRLIKRKYPKLFHYDYTTTCPKFFFYKCATRLRSIVWSVPSDFIEIKITRRSITKSVAMRSVDSDGDFVQLYNAYVSCRVRPRYGLHTETHIWKNVQLSTRTADAREYRVLFIVIITVFNAVGAITFLT